MHIVQITPGAGGMYCGNCFRDNALVAELRKQGHTTDMIPLYLPMTLEDEDQSAGTPIFFSGINVYLEQKMPLLKYMPEWLHSALESPSLLKLAAGKAAKTRPADLGDITISMLKGEDGKQARELAKLISFLERSKDTHLISLSNALLVGMARRLKKHLKVPVVCMLQGEDSFLDSLPESHRKKAWDTVSERAQDVDLFIAPSHYFGELMTRRLSLPATKVKVIHNGIDSAGYKAAAEPPKPPVLGYFARMCREKGVHLVIETFIEVKKRHRVPHLKLHIGGGMGPRDEAFVNELKARLQQESLLADVLFFPNLDKAQKQRFFQNISVFCVPALYGEAFGLYLLEAWAAGVPAVQPPVASFPELIKNTGAGVIAKSASHLHLADKVEDLLLEEPLRRELGARGRKAVEAEFSASTMTRHMIDAFESLTAQKESAPLPQKNGLRV
jgi:glycosyltransferase involved in cell wall biosynthesis